MSADRENDHARLERLRDWIGRTERHEDEVTPAPAAALAALLDRDASTPVAGSAIPPLAHWLYFPAPARQSELGEDGHRRRGEFLPPVPLPRRMWAGGRLAFHDPLRIGERIVRESRVADVAVKRGRVGTLVFVTVRHEIANATGVAVTEEHDIVYRGDPGPEGPATVATVAATDETFRRRVVPDPVLLFRYSALTANAHRIHYDHPYATGVEGYPGLVVHGPLVATLLLDLLRREHPECRVSRFSFRAVAPLFDIAPFELCGRTEPGTANVALWARDAEGRLAVEASAERTDSSPTGERT